MKNQRDFLKCATCGNVLGVVEDTGSKLVCCGNEMDQLLPNTVDAAQEKHLPVAKREGNKITVSVGSVLHPMTPEHHISWIVIAQGSLTQRKALDKTGNPTTTFLVEDGGDITLYSYCNLHGLWAAEF